MELQDQFTVLYDMDDGTEREDKSAIFYMTQQDCEDLISALSIAIKSPTSAFVKNSQRFPTLMRQLKQVIK